MESRKSIKKVLFLTNIPSPYRVAFFEELGKYCDLTVLYEKQFADDREWMHENKSTYKSVFLKGRKTGPDHALCFEVKKFLKRDYDVIVIGGYSTPTGMLAIRYLHKKKIPFYLNCDGGFIREERKINYQIKKYFISKATYWLCSGQKAKEYLVHYGAKEENIYIYPFSSVHECDVVKESISGTEKGKIKEELEIREERVIVSVGQFIHRKGFDILIKACKGLEQDVGIYIIGGTPTEEYIQLVKDCDVNNLHFIKFCQPDVLRKYYRAADCMAFPTREDIWGLVINEALANGLPIVSTDKCIAAIELLDEAGYIVPSEDSEAMHKAIKEIINNSKVQSAKAEKAREIGSKYTIESMARAHVDIFNMN